MGRSMRAHLAATGLAIIAVAASQDGFAATRVGVTSAVNQDASAQVPGRGTRTITIGDEVIHNQVVNTSGEGLVQILLADGTAFTVGPNSSLTIDSFVYDPDAGTAKVSASLSKGFMRFIGGRTSKTPGGATINTPIGTAGIRGAVVDIDLGAIGQRPREGKKNADGRNGDEDGKTPPHVSLIFGHEVILSFDGRSNRLFHPGYSIVVDGAKRTVMRTPPSFLHAMQARLASRNGTNGGVSAPPHDSQVRASGVAEHNSDSPLPANVPVPQTRPDVLPEQIATGAAKASAVELAAATAVGDGGSPPDDGDGGADPGSDPDTGGGGTDPGPDPGTGGGDGGTDPGTNPGTDPGTGGGDGGTDPDPVSRTATVRVLTARAADDGGGNGILGGSEESDRTATLTGDEGSDGTATFGDGDTLTLPVYADSAFTSHAVSGYAYGGSTYFGNVYVGAEGFRAYMLSNGTDPLYAIAGTPTADAASVFSTTGTRHYALTADALSPIITGSGSVIPFAFAPRLSGVDLSGAVSSDLLIAGTPNGSNTDVLAKGLQSWIVIDGTGANQKSAIGMMTGVLGLLGDGASYGFTGQRGGSDRLDALGGSVAYSGTVASASGGDGGTAVFGSNGEYMVLTNDLDDPYSAFRDRSNENNLGTDETVDFSSAHVGNLTSTDVGVSQSYDGRTLSGYSSITLSTNSVPEVKAGTVEMDFDAADATFDAVFNQFDDDGNLYNDEIGFTDDYGGAVYLDDDAFAAAGTNNRSYVVNSKVVPVKIFDGGTSTDLCTCSYLSWGWWGMADSGDGAVVSGHMGNWVIGDVTANVDLPASGTATYSGHAVGSVLDGSSQYIATGNMNATMNFGSRTGSVAISDFDGRNFNSNVSFATSSTFTGANGTTKITGSFANGGGQAAKGIMGAFSTSDGGWSASGIFGGNRN